MPQLAPRSSSRATRTVEQAVFTSVQGRQNHGYQLTSASPGIDAGQRRELILWGPSHDSLLPGCQSALSFFRLKDGTAVLARTSCAGEEYSHRGGARLYTQFFLLAPDLMDRFSWQPFRVHEAIVGGGHARLLPSPPEQLEPIRLIGRAAMMQLPQLQDALREVGPNRLLRFLQIAMAGRPLALAASVAPELILRSAFDLLPWKARQSVSFTNGLRHSPRRPFRWYMLGNDPHERKRLLRQSHQEIVDLTDDDPAGELDPWSGRIARLIEQRQWDDLMRLVEASKDRTLQEAAELACGWE